MVYTKSNDNEILAYTRDFVHVGVDFFKILLVPPSLCYYSYECVNFSSTHPLV